MGESIDYVKYYCMQHDCSNYRDAEKIFCHDCFYALPDKDQSTVRQACTALKPQEDKGVIPHGN